MTLSVSQLCVSIDGRRILDRIDLEVGDREIVSVMGANGTGKTTLLRAIAGLVAVESGSVAIDGRDVATIPTHRRGVGLVFQDLALFPHLDVAGNIGYGLRMQGISRSQRASRVADLLRLVRLDGFEGRRVDTLSGGERQRVAIARALAPRPTVLLLDEPFAAVDASVKEGLVVEIGSLLRSLSVTAVHVTHDTAEPERIGSTRTLHL